MPESPSLILGTVCLDCADAHEMARFYGGLLGWEPTFVEPDWVLMRDPRGGTGLSFQTTEGYERPTWPEAPGRQQKMLHLDVWVAQWAKAPNRRAKVTVQATGFTLDTGRTLYAHYTGKGKALKTQAVGKLDDGCGDLTATMRQFPAELKPGRYTVAFNASRTWKKSDFSVKLKATKLRTKR